MIATCHAPSKNKAPIHAGNATGTIFIAPSVVLLDDGSVLRSVNRDHAVFMSALAKAEPTYSNHVMVDVFRPASKLVVYPPVRALMEAPNAGGESAQYSEYLSGHLYYGGLGARNFVEEMAVRYWVDYKKVDYLCDLFGVRVGVSVKRAVNRSLMMAIKNLAADQSTEDVDDSDFTDEQAMKLINSSVRGLVVARNCVNDNHNFDRSVLHVWCPTMAVAQRLRRAFQAFDLDDHDLDVQGVLVLHLTVCHQRAVYVGR